jgi:hypothetical protein
MLELYGIGYIILKFFVFYGFVYMFISLITRIWVMLREIDSGVEMSFSEVIVKFWKLHKVNFPAVKRITKDSFHKMTSKFLKRVLLKK